MKLTIESTDIITTIDGVPVRLWVGRTEGGHRLHVFVHRIGSASREADEELAAGLVEVTRPVELADVEAEGRRREIARN